jgi:hypothetical protein
MMRSLIIACLVLVALTGAAEEYDKDSETIMVSPSSSGSSRIGRSSSA